MFLFAFAYSLIGYQFVYSLVIKMKDFKEYEDEIREDDHDFKLAKRTVIIRNIPNYFSTLYSNIKLTNLLRERIGTSFEGVTTLGRYRNLFRLLNERIEIASRLNKHMNRLYRLQESERSAKTKKEEKHSEQAVVECQSKLKLKNNQIRREAEICIQNNEGIAFALFRTSEDAISFIEDVEFMK